MCGNFGLLLAAAASGDIDAVQLLERMAEVTMGRGGQSGGVATFLASPTDSRRVAAVRARVLPGRREAMAPLLARSLRKQLFLARLKQLHMGGIQGGLPRLYLGHTRFATSSLPSTRESHPHQWTAPHTVTHWRLRGSGLRQLVGAPYAVFITHNGDFDFLRVDDRDWPQGDVGIWLAALLHVPCPAKCDSAKIAGLVELFRTQGLWRASFRLAYQDCIAQGAGVNEAVFGKPQEGTTTVYESPDDVGDDVDDGKAAELPNLPTVEMLDALGALGDATCASWVATLSAATGSAVEPTAASIAAVDSLPSWFSADPSRELCLVEALDSALAKCPALGSGRQLSRRRVRQLAAIACSHFIRGDLFASLRRLMATAKGSFGLAAGCSLDTGTVALAALNQPMSMAFEPSTGCVMYASEAQALAVPIFATESKKSASGQIGAAWRLDINSVDGEVWEVKTTSSTSHSVDGHADEEAAIGAVVPFSTATALKALLPAYDNSAVPMWPFGPASGVRLRLHSVQANSGVSAVRDLPGTRLIQMTGNAFLLQDDVPRRSTARFGADRVENDLRDTARVLDRLRATWYQLNGQSADALFAMLRQRALDSTAATDDDEKQQRSGRLDIDVLVTGCESSLWVAEQFASDLQTLFPHLRVVAISANKVIGVLGNARGAVSATGFSFCRLTAKLGQAICIAMSHSGQTFGTLHATSILERACPGRVFVVTGCIDTKMGAAVGQRLAPGAPFCCRIFTTNAGWRAAEPASVSALAMHHLCTELLLHLMQRFASEAAPKPGAGKGDNAEPALGAKPLGLRFSSQDVDDLYTVRDAFVGNAVPCMTGVDAGGREVRTDVRDELLQQGRQWAWNVLEAPFAWAFCATYITLAVVFGWPFFRTMLNFAIRGTDRTQHIAYDWTRPDAVAPQWEGFKRLFTALFYIAGFLDAALFIFLPAISTCCLRLLQGRPVLARIKGKRSLVIADVPFVHQLLEIYVSKLFSLSYGIAGIEVHGANPADHFVHRFTHRVARGVMLAFGRQDGRLCSQTKVESWNLMAMLQARTIMNMGTGPEVLTVGHNSYRNGLMDTAIVLPTHRPRLLCESVLGVQEHEPLARLAALEYAVDKGERPTLSEMALHVRNDNGMSVRYGGSVSLAGMQRHFDAPIGAHLCSAGHSHHSGTHGAVSEHSTSGDEVGSSVTSATMALARRQAAHLNAAADRASEAEEIGSTVHGPGPSQRAAVLSGLMKPVVDLLESQADIESFIENRFLAAERYTAFLVLFHAMAARVAAFWPLTFDVSRSQSCLRVATTASPVSAADLVRSYQAGTLAGLDDHSYHGGGLGNGQSTAEAGLVPDISFRGGSGFMSSVRSFHRIRGSRTSLTSAAHDPTGSFSGSEAAGTVWGAQAAHALLSQGGTERWWEDQVTTVTSGEVVPTK